MKASSSPKPFSKLDACRRFFAEAIQQQQQGKYELALQTCQRILSTDPLFEDAHMMLGVIYAQHQRFDEAREHFKRVSMLNPSHLGALYNQGLMQLQLGQTLEAEETFKRILARNHQHIPTLNSLGVLYAQSSQFDKAKECMSVSLSLAPEQPDVFNNLGNCNVELGQLQEAESCYRQAEKLAPNFLDPAFNLAKLYAKSARIEESIGKYSWLLQNHPRFTPARINLSKILVNEGRCKEAIFLLTEEVNHAPSDPVLWFALGVAYKEHQNYSKSIESFDRAIQLNPKYHSAYVNRADSLREMNCFDDALNEIKKAHDATDAETLSMMWSLYATLYEDMHLQDKVEHAFKKAIEYDPENIKPHLNYGFWLLKQQRFSEGWPLYQYRHKIKATMPIHWLDQVPIWSGGRVEGRILILGEQGVGDQVFYSKFLSLFLEKYASPSSVTVDERLLPAYGRTFPGVTFLPQSARGKLKTEDFDLQLGMADLAHLMGLDPKKNATLKYPSLKVRSAELPLLSPKIGRPIVGISWKSMNTKNGSDKSLDLREMMSHFSEINAEWINLQYGDVNKELSAVQSDLGVQIRSIPEVDVFNDLEGLMQLINECDFVISGSNSTAHFAGALGKPGVILVPFSKGKLWYWHTQDGPSPWYPSLQIIHAKSSHDWTGALSQAHQLIRSRLGSTH